MFVTVVAKVKNTCVSKHSISLDHQENKNLKKKEF